MGAFRIQAQNHLLLLRATTEPGQGQLIVGGLASNRTPLCNSRSHMGWRKLACARGGSRLSPEGGGGGLGNGHL